jgi:hypothetical protein
MECPVCQAGPQEPCRPIIHPLRVEPDLLPHHHVRYWLLLADIRVPGPPTLFDTESENA